MDSKYKRTLARIAAVISIIASFSLGSVDRAYAKNDEGKELAIAAAEQEMSQNCEWGDDCLMDGGNTAPKSNQEGTSSPNPSISEGDVENAPAMYDGLTVRPFNKEEEAFDGASLEHFKNPSLEARRKLKEAEGSLQEAIQKSNLKTLETLVKAHYYSNKESDREAVANFLNSHPELKAEVGDVHAKVDNEYFAQKKINKSEALDRSPIGEASLPTEADGIFLRTPTIVGRAQNSQQEVKLTYGAKDGDVTADLADNTKVYLNGELMDRGGRNNIYFDLSKDSVSIKYDGSNSRIDIKTDTPTNPRKLGSNEKKLITLVSAIDGASDNNSLSKAQDNLRDFIDKNPSMRGDLKRNDLLEVVKTTNHSKEREAAAKVNAEREEQEAVDALAKASKKIEERDTKKEANKSIVVLDADGGYLIGAPNAVVMHEGSNPMTLSDGTVRAIEVIGNPSDGKGLTLLNQGNNILIPADSRIVMFLNGQKIDASGGGFAIDCSIHNIVMQYAANGKIQISVTPLNPANRMLAEGSRNSTITTPQNNQVVIIGEAPSLQGNKTVITTNQNGEYIFVKPNIMKAAIPEVKVPTVAPTVIPAAENIPSIKTKPVVQPTPIPTIAPTVISIVPAPTVVPTVVPIAPVPVVAPKVIPAAKKTTSIKTKPVVHPAQVPNVAPKAIKSVHGYAPGASNTTDKQKGQTEFGYVDKLEISNNALALE